MRRTLALALVLWSLPAVAAAAPVVVRLAPAVTVHGDEVVLSDVADIQGEGALADRLRALRIVPAPPAGATHALTAETIRVRLHAAQAAAPRVQLTGARGVQVTRGFQLVRAQDLVDAVRREARARLTAEGRGEGWTLLPIGRADDVRVPTGDVHVDARLHDAVPLAAALAATVSVQVGGRERHQAVLTFQVARLVTVLVAARALEPRRTIGRDDLRVEQRPAAEVPPDALGDLAEPGDQEVLRPVPAGEVITPRVVRPRLLVKRGELVTLLLDGDGFRITTQGQASEDARRGDVVRVVNVSSRREVVGRVEGGGVVRVPTRPLGAAR